jgi:predicted amidophosphoribosyltransferase
VEPRLVPPQVPLRGVVIFDDVVATGATMTAAALALIHAGASQVVGVALAREALLNH